MALGRKIKWILIKNNKDEIINWLNLEKTIKETIPRTRRINIGIKKFAGVKKTSISSLKTFQIMSFSEEARVSNTIGKDDINEIINDALEPRKASYKSFYDSNN